jgi:DNA-binding SARP family transcriptional activator
MHPLPSPPDPETTVGKADRPVLICLLGAFSILSGGEPISVRAGGKHEALLTCLALESGRPVRRDELLELLWPGTESELAGQSLNTLVYGLHRLLADAAGGAPIVLYNDGWYRLNCEAGIRTDVECFEALVHAGDEHARAGEAERAAETYSRAVEVYRGDLCVEGSTRALILREHLRATYLTVLGRLADHWYRAGEYLSCLDVASRLLARDPCREDAHRLVMRCYVRLGERAQALRQFRVCERILQSEFDVAPEPETLELFDQVRMKPATV